MKGTSIAMIVLGLGAAGAIGYFTFSEKPIPPERVTTTKVKRTTVVRRVRGVGHIEPVTQVKVSANISGDLLKLLVKDGAVVKRGQLLAEIDREQWAAVVRQNEASARSQRAAVQLEEAQLQQARSDMRRTEALQKQALATDSETEKAHAAVSVIEAQLESAKQRVLQSEASLDEAKAKLEETRVVAPIDGTVISLKKKEGEKIRGSDLAEDILLVLAPLHAMQVEVEVTEGDVVGLEVGQKADITVDALKGTIVRGKVVEIANSAVIRNQGLETETTSFPVKVALEENPEHLRSGMTAQVAIATEQKDDVVAVPIEAVAARLPSQLEKTDKARTEEQRSFFGGKPPVESSMIIKKERPVEIVFVVNGGIVEPKRVKTGIFSDSEIEIVEGVEEGTEIVTGPYKSLARTLGPGTAVEVEPETAETPKPSTPSHPVARE